MTTTSLPTPRPFLIMGVINVTPDSFSDGGDCLSVDSAYQRATTLAEQGADLIDIGAESTRPNATPISNDDEWQRLEPVLNLLTHKNFPLPISVDTRKPTTMKRLHDYPIAMLNDVGCNAPPPILKSFAQHRVNYLAMHMHGNPHTMQVNPLPAKNIVPTLKKFFQTQIAVLHSCGFADEQIWIDPGIGFGKSDKAIMRIFTNLHELSTLAPIAIGVSRKSWIGRQFNLPTPKSRDDLSKILELSLVWQGAKLIRTHEVTPLFNLRKLLR